MNYELCPQNNLNFTLMHKPCKQNPSVGLVSRVSISKWRYLSFNPIMSFFILLQRKKQQLQPLSSRHLLPSCGEEVWWSILGLNKQSQLSPSNMTLLNFFRLLMLWFLLGGRTMLNLSEMREMLWGKNEWSERIDIMERKERMAQCKTVNASDSTKPHSPKRSLNEKMCP